MKNIQKMLMVIFTIFFTINVSASSTKSMMYDTNDKVWQKQTALQKRLLPKKLPMVTATNKNKPYTDINDSRSSGDFKSGNCL